MLLSRRPVALIVALAVIALAPSVLANDETALALRMYVTPTAHALGDLLTIVVDESISSSTKASSSSSKEASLSGIAGTASNQTTAGTGSKLSELIADLDIPGYKLGGDSRFTGSGEQATAEAMATRFTARVTDVQGNGVLVVQGERVLRFKEETVTITFSGLVRTPDITRANTVLSSQVSDARILYNRSGELSRGSQPGFLTRLLHRITPW